MGKRKTVNGVLIKLLAFDWDGTLFDSTGIISRCIQASVRDVGGSVPSDVDATYVIGMDLSAALRHAAPDIPAQKHPLLVERFKFHYKLHQHDISLFEGVLEMLADLKARNYLLTVATGKSRSGLNEALQAVELRGVFDGSRTAEETAGKPHPMMLQELMAEFGASPEEVLMIGDTTHDLQMALHAGCPSIGVSYGAHGSAGLTLLNPRFIAHSVSALHEWFLEDDLHL